MAVTLYRRQRQIFDFISQYIQKFGTSPTLQEIADAIDDLRFEIEEMKEEIGEIKLMLQDVIDRLSEEKE